MLNNYLLQPPHILIVEDNPPQALRLKLGLESDGCQVHWADTGTAGLEAAHDQKFDLIILDGELPDMTGFDVCRQLKADVQVADIPVIMLTTRDRAGDVLAGLENGAVDYIPKDPFAEAVLLETIKQMRL
jgi:DNA-binding response OmpR family regulator